ncbi:uncharacterized protein LOC133832782 [Humulus lupulus]|uniref:uncharacterized protein LOC133832782 n=1 Tax=Humulus lupulus TaxID=3486 RepID=UPI002B40A422|nr:uncharacterized protein LOC133832782 [Humulus lupulus]
MKAHLAELEKANAQLEEEKAATFKIIENEKARLLNEFQEKKDKAVDQAMYKIWANNADLDTSFLGPLEAKLVDQWNARLEAEEAAREAAQEAAQEAARKDSHAIRLGGSSAASAEKSCLAQICDVSRIQAQRVELRAALATSQDNERIAKEQVIEASRRRDKLQVEVDSLNKKLKEVNVLKNKLSEVKVKAKEDSEKAKKDVEQVKQDVGEATNALEEMLYRCWAYYQEGDFSFLDTKLWGRYLTKFHSRLSQEPSETVEASGAAEGGDDEVTSQGQVIGAQ